MLGSYVRGQRTRCEQQCSDGVAAPQVATECGRQPMPLHTDQCADDQCAVSWPPIEHRAIPWRPPWNARRTPCSNELPGLLQMTAIGSVGQSVWVGCGLSVTWHTDAHMYGHCTTGQNKRVDLPCLTVKQNQPCIGSWCNCC